jgi:RNA polymerase sigma factor (sigma-70 family)
VDYVRKNKEFQSNGIEDDAREGNEFDSIDTKILLEHEISKLKSNYRAIIQMVEGEDMTIREAAKVLKISEAHARVLNYRAKKKLRKHNGCCLYSDFLCNKDEVGRI